MRLRLTAPGLISWCAIATLRPQPLPLPLPHPHIHLTPPHPPFATPSASLHHCISPFLFHAPTSSLPRVGVHCFSSDCTCVCYIQNFIFHRDIGALEVCTPLVPHLPFSRVSICWTASFRNSWIRPWRQQVLEKDEQSIEGFLSAKERAWTMNCRWSFNMYQSVPTYRMRRVSIYGWYSSSW